MAAPGVVVGAARIMDPLALRLLEGVAAVTVAALAVAVVEAAASAAVAATAVMLGVPGPVSAVVVSSKCCARRSSFRLRPKPGSK